MLIISSENCWRNRFCHIISFAPLIPSDSTHGNEKYQKHALCSYKFDLVLANISKSNASNFMNYEVKAVIAIKSSFASLKWSNCRRRYKPLNIFLLASFMDGPYAFGIMQFLLFIAGVSAELHNSGIWVKLSKIKLQSLQ